MQDRSLSGAERSKRIQDIMAGRVDLSEFVAPPPPATKSPADRDGRPSNPLDTHGRSGEEIKKSLDGNNYGSERSSYYSERSDSDDSSKRGGGSASSSVENQDANVPVAAAGEASAEPTGGEAMLEDMLDESDTQLAKRMAIEEMTKDRSLGGSESNKRIQDIMAGRVKLPPPKVAPVTSDSPEKVSDAPENVQSGCVLGKQ